MHAKFVNESLNSFERFNDVKKNLQIGKRVQIENWLNNKNNFHRGLCGINDDFTIDVFLTDYANDPGIDFSNLPEYIKFNIIHCGTIIFNVNSLKGFPKVIDGNLSYSGSVTKEEIKENCI